MKSCYSATAEGAMMSSSARRCPARLPLLPSGKYKPSYDLPHVVPTSRPLLMGIENSRQHRCWRDAGTSDTHSTLSQKIDWRTIPSLGNLVVQLRTKARMPMSIGILTRKQIALLTTSTSPASTTPSSPVSPPPFFRRAFLGMLDVLRTS